MRASVETLRLVCEPLKPLMRQSALTLRRVVQVDSFSSALVLWRFWGGGTVLPESVLELREKRASVGIAIAFVALGVVVGTVAIQHLSEAQARMPPTMPTGLGVRCSAAAACSVATAQLCYHRVLHGRHIRS